MRQLCSVQRRLEPPTPAETAHSVSFLSGPSSHSRSDLSTACRQVFWGDFILEGFANLYFLMQFYTEQISLNSVSIKDPLKHLRVQCAYYFWLQIRQKEKEQN